MEYKINFLSNFQGGEIRATGRVTKAGKRIIVTSAEVVHINDSGQRSDCAGDAVDPGCLCPKLTSGLFSVGGVQRSA